MALGVIVFLVGIALLLLTFRFAYDTFTSPPSAILHVNEHNALDIPRSGQNLATQAYRVLALVLMGLFGSLIANRGVSLITASRAHKTED